MIYPPPSYYMWTVDPPYHHHAIAHPTSHMPPPLYQQPWGPYSHPHPHQYQYHGSCSSSNHAPSPSYYACPYPPPPPPPFPAPYSVPPQHYTLEQQQQQQPHYDKTNNHHYCCGCCNHHQDEKKQPESQADNKTSNSLLLKDRPIYINNTPHQKETYSPPPPVSVNQLLEPSNHKDKYPHDTVSLKRGENEDEQGHRFPFQIFWLPPNNLDQVNNLDLKGLPDQKTINNSEGECENQPVSTNAVQKVIPVKQASANEDNKNPKTMDHSSSKASPKLPPVCLRIDPLPKKKKTSRSPSPGGKETSNASPVNSPKSSQQQQPQVLNKSKEEGDIKTIDHANKVERTELPREKGDQSDKGKEDEKKNTLSEHEAALIIQSVYRGFEVRRSQPLKKLRQISQVKQQIFDLRNRTQELLETSSSIDGKKQVIIGETIMSLLLKLDTIQGLHPFVREVRKSVAKELVGLQEKLDSVKSETTTTTSEGTVGSHQHPENDAIRGTRLEKGTEDDDQAPTECDTVKCEVDAQEGCNIEKIDRVVCENHQVEPQEGISELPLESAPTECDGAKGLCEVKATEGELLQLEDEEAPTECNEAPGLCENHQVEARESHGEPQLGSQAPTGCDLESTEGNIIIIGEPQLEDEAPIECDEASGLHHEVESSHSTIGGESRSDSTNEACEEANGGDMKKIEEDNNTNTGEVNEMPGESEDSDICDVAYEDGKAMGEENEEKLRMAVEELMKAGKEQLGVIKELTGRVKDLEKKLSKNKKKKKLKKVNKERRRRVCDSVM